MNLLHYEIQKKLGQGGMGIVFQAHDTKLGRTVALKLITSLEPKAIVRFKKEAKSLARLNHDHILKIYDLCEIDDLSCLSEYDVFLKHGLIMVMEFIKGLPLDKMLGEGTLNGEYEESLRITREVASALETIHENGLIHRDIKPGNIMIREENRRAVVMDFGLVKDDDSQLTQPGAILGTPAFMAPELFSGGQASIQTDIYALGVTLYNMINGRNPFEGSTVTIICQITQKGVPPLELPDEWKWLDFAIQKMTAKNLQERFSSMREAIEALKIGATPKALNTFCREQSDSKATTWCRNSVAQLSKATTSFFRSSIANTLHNKKKPLVLLSLFGVCFLLSILAFFSFLRSAAKPNPHITEDEAKDEKKTSAYKKQNIEANEQQKRPGIAKNEAKDKKKTSVVSVQEAKPETKAKEKTSVVSVQEAKIETKAKEQQEKPSSQEEETKKPLNVVEHTKSENVKEDEESKSHTQEPKSEQPHFDQMLQKGSEAMQKESYAEALECFSKAIEINATDVRGWACRADAYAKLNQIEEVSKDLVKVIEIEPENAEAHAWLGGCYEVLQRFDEANQEYTRSIECNPDNATYRSHRARILVYFQKFGDALDDLKKARELEPGHAQWNYELGMLYRYLQQYDKAHTSLSTAIALQNDYSEAYWKRAENYSDLKKHHDALKDYEKAIKYNSNNAYIFLSRYYLYQRIGDQKKSLVDIEKAIELHNDPMFFFEKAKTLVGILGIHRAFFENTKVVISKQQIEVIIQDFSTALSSSNEKHQILLSRGICYTILCDYQRAIEDATVIITENDKHVEAYIVRAKCYLYQKRIDPAQSDIDTALRLAPTDKRIKKLSRWIKEIKSH